MQIRSIQMLNYRCFTDSGEIHLSDFSIFIGRNDGGKSSALLALYKLLGGPAFEDDDHRKEPDAEGGDANIAPTLEVRVRLSDANTDYHYRCRRALASPPDMPVVHYELEQECVGHRDLNAAFEDLPLDQLKELCAKYELVTTGPQNRKSTFVDALHRYVAELPKESGWVTAPKAFRDRLPMVFYYAEGAESDPQQTIRQSMTQFYKLSILPNHRAELEGMRKQVQEQLDAEASKFVPVLAEHCPGVEDITVDIGEGSFEDVRIGSVRITQAGGAAIDWLRIGRGKRREMSLAVFRFSANLLKDALLMDTNLGEDSQERRHVIAVFDEPDLNLDYEAQRRMNIILQSLSEYPRCQVAVATHSVNLIDNTPLNQICFFGTSCKDSGCSKVECFDPEEDSEVLEVLRNSMGLRNSALFNEKLFVLCEGPTEMAALPLLFGYTTKTSMSLCGIHLINGLDNEEAKRMAKILKKNGRAVHLVLDSDCCEMSKFSDDSLTKAYLDPQTEVSFLGQTEFEDSFDDNVWLSNLNEFYPRQTGQLWTVADLEDAHDSKKFSEYMINAIGQCSDHVSKPELGQNLARVAVKLNKVPAEIVELTKNINQRAKEL
ncbi:MAG: ATP-dependent nuclease [Armatimonadota bacterium]